MNIISAENKDTMTAEVKNKNNPQLRIANFISDEMSIKIIVKSWENTSWRLYSIHERHY